MDNPTFQQRLEQMTQEVRELFKLPGISVSVTVDGADYHAAAGMADMEAGVSATPQTLYAIGSVTKAFTATLICMLAQQGKLDLDAPVRTYLPDFEMYDPYMTEHLTVRDILCHRCGLPRYDLSMFNRPNLTTTQSWVDLVRHMQPVFEPRTKFSYQNHMFMLATVLAEKLHGQKWADLVRDKIFTPLGMGSAYGDGSLAPEGPLKARPYVESDDLLKRIPFNYHEEVSGAGTIYASTEDMLRWLRFRLEGDERLVSQALLNEMHTPQMVIKPGDRPFGFDEIDVHGYCLGWTAETYQGVKLIQHGGAIDGFKAAAMLAPKAGFAVAALANHNSTTAATALTYMVADAVLGLEPIDWGTRYLDLETKMKAEQKQATEASRAKAEAAGERYGDLADAVGVYSEAVYGDLALELENGKPVLVGFGERFPMRGGAGDLFVVFSEIFGMSLEVQLSRDGAGKITGLSIPLEPMRKDPIPFIKVQ